MIITISIVIAICPPPTPHHPIVIIIVMAILTINTIPTLSVAVWLEHMSSNGILNTAIHQNTSKHSKVQGAFSFSGPFNCTWAQNPSHKTTYSNSNAYQKSKLSSTVQKNSYVFIHRVQSPSIPWHLTLRMHIRMFQYIQIGEPHSLWLYLIRVLQ